MKNKRKSIKEEWSEIRDDLRQWKEDGKQTFKEFKADLPSKAEFKQAIAEDKEKRRRKEAEYNPSTFNRIFTATSIAFTTIIAIMLIPTIVGIPISALIFGMNVWAWRKYVVKKPEVAGNENEIEVLRERIVELERGNNAGKGNGD